MAWALSGNIKGPRGGSTNRSFSNYNDLTSDAPIWNQTPTKVFDAADSQYATIYWPWILKKQGLPFASTGAVGNGNYVMYYSTDHSVPTGGIAVATADSPGGPWTNRGQVYNDTVVGQSTETPSVWYDPSANLFRMLYQQAGAVTGANQSTLQATSTNGNSWTRRPTSGEPTQADGAIIILPGTYPGDGHSGYAVVLDGNLPNEKVAYHLAGGGNNPHFAMSVSKDYGATWRTNPQLLMYGWDQTQSVLTPSRIEWNSGHVFRFNGRRWWVGLISNFASGGGAVSRYLCQAPLSDDGRRLLGIPRKVITAATAADLRSVYLLHEDDTFYLYWTVDKEEMFMTTASAS